MTRQLDTATLDDAGRDYARMFLGSSQRSPSGKFWIDGPERVFQDLFNFHFKDEFDHVLGAMKANLGDRAVADLEREQNKRFPQRTDKVYDALLKERLAIDRNGNHIEGARGLVVVGKRPIMMTMAEVEKRWSIRRRKEMGLPLHVPGRDDRVTHMVQRMEYWPVYAGEAEERGADRIGGMIDELPPGALLTLPDGRLATGIGANVPTFSAESIIGAVDFVADSLDEGSTAATIRGRTGTQPADPDASETGTLLFTLTCSDPAFGGAADDGDGTVSCTASSITDDSSADATGTLGYCRAGATGTGADDHIDGEAGTSSADFVFNTLSIVSGAVISMTSFVIHMSQGSTAS